MKTPGNINKPLKTKLPPPPFRPRRGKVRKQLPPGMPSLAEFMKSIRINK